MNGTSDGTHDAPTRVPDLRDLIDQSVGEIIACARDGGWAREEVLLAIDDCLALRWPKESDAGTYRVEPR